MSPSTVRTKPNYKLLALGGAFLLPPGWVVFNGMTHLATMPFLVAIFTVGVLAAGAITLVYLALQNLATGDVRDATWQLCAAALVLLAEFVGQWWFAATENHALVTALVMSMASVMGALVIEGEIMRVWKANARATGQLSLARPRVPREVAREFPVVGRIANRLAIRYPNATQRSILAEAFQEYDALPVEAPPAPAQVRVDVSELVSRPDTPVQIEAAPGQRPDVTGHENGTSGHPVESVRALVPADGQITDAVRALVEDGADKDGAVRTLTARWPGVKADSVRRAYDRAVSRSA